MSLLLKDDGRADGHDLREFGRVPVSEPDASMRFRVADQGWLGRTVNAVVFLGNTDPYHADRIVRSRLNFSLLIRFGCVPEKIRIVVKDWLRTNDRYFPVSDRQGIVLASAGHGIFRDYASRCIEGLQRMPRLDTTILAAFWGGLSPTFGT